MEETCSKNIIVNHHSGGYSPLHQNEDIKTKSTTDLTIEEQGNGNIDEENSSFKKRHGWRVSMMHQLRSLLTVHEYSWQMKVFLTCFFFYLVAVIVVNIYLSLGNRRRIHLFGDSLIQVPCEKYDLHYDIRNDLFAHTKATYIPELSYFGHGGYRIADLRASLHSHVFYRIDYTSFFTWQYAPLPHVVILYWDSDITPGPKDGTSSLDTHTIATYLDHMQSVLSQLLTHGCLVILAGPTLGGELPRGQNPNDLALDMYVRINHHLAIDYNLTYLHTRDLYFAALPTAWNVSHGYLTVDGEHPNYRGTQILRKAFREAILQQAESLWK